MLSDDVPVPRAALGLLTVLLLLAPVPVQSRSSDPPVEVAPPLRGPADHAVQPLERAALPTLAAQSADLSAVAIVGDVGDHTYLYKDDMEQAVQVLRSHDVSVTKFYYGDRAFGWSDVVAAAADAHFLLYMGHGVYWGGSCASPTEVGGFYLGSEFVHPDQIRSDLAGWMAADSIVIFSHACFSAGHTSCDPSGAPSQAEAERRVRMYAAPFVDVGIWAYFANNYNGSAATIVNRLLADPAQRKTVGGVFKSVHPYEDSEFRDLSFPGASGYDLWLSGHTGFWSHAFVGIPSYVFSADLASPELGRLPTSLAFTYNTATSQLSPASQVLTPLNVGTDAALDWSVSQEGNWFAVSPTRGTSPPDRITITPLPTSLASLPVGHYDGAVTVRVTDPSDTESGVQRVNLGLEVVVPRLGSLPSELNFSYFYSVDVQIPSAHHLTPKNVGSTDELSWELTQEGDWFTISPASGVTDSAFTVVPDQNTVRPSATHTGRITVSVTAPAGTQDAVQVIPVSYRAVSGKPAYVYMPLLERGW